MDCIREIKFIEKQQNHLILILYAIYQSCRSWKLASIGERIRKIPRKQNEALDLEEQMKVFQNVKGEKKKKKIF